MTSRFMVSVARCASMTTMDGRETFRLLVVDDNKDAADSMCVLARLWGFEVMWAYDGETALETARSFNPDCLLLDIDLPGIDGFRVAEELRWHQSSRHLKLVALTAHSEDAVGSRMKAAGFDHHLVKPADPVAVEELLKMLERTMRIAEQTEHLARQNVALAKETREILTEVKEEIKEMKEDIREVKEELKEMKRDNPEDGS